jgi:hypothetical protein
MITTKDKLQCVERELALRDRVYRRLVTNGKMTVNQARHEINLMTAIAEDYRRAVELEEPELEMFIETRQTIERR